MTIYKQHFRVTPPVGHGEALEQVFPVTYMDMPWVYFNPIQSLLFYRFPCSNQYFDETIVPNLKESLSQTLEHYLLLAGNLQIPSNSSMPELRIVSGDSVSFTVAEASEDFDIDYLTGYHARDAKVFYEFVPCLPEPKIDSDSGFKTMPLFSTQVTLFPGTGICLGWTAHHVAADAGSFIRFIKSWSSIARLGKYVDTYDFLEKNSLLSLLDRSVITDPYSRRATISWKHILNSGAMIAPQNIPTTELRQTFRLTKSDIQKLRNSVLPKKPWLLHLSTYAIMTAYVWSCIVKLASKVGEKVDAQEPEFLIITADARSRQDPPVPVEYYGNCIYSEAVGSTHGELKGDEGFCNAVELIGDYISKHINDKDEFMKGADDNLERVQFLIGKRLFSANGFPNFAMYDVDFGFGKPVKYEVLSIDMNNCVSLCKSRDSEGGPAA